MTVRKRLALSNLLMILVPVVITLVIAAGCLLMIWAVHDRGISFDDNEDFYRAGSGLGVTVREALEADPDKRKGNLKRLSSLIDREHMALTVLEDGKSYYSYGESSSADDSLVRAVSSLDSSGTATRGSRSIYADKVKVGDHTYTLYIFSRVGHVTYGTLKASLAVAGVILIITIILSVFFTDRFLIKFVFKRIEEPLDILTAGVREIGRGNLDYRIVYDHDDEFTPVCEEFNKMAWYLKRSVDDVTRHEENHKELLADISHDIRSPLTSIQAYAEGLIDGVADTPEKQQKYLMTIKTKAEDLQRMVSQISLFSKLDLDEYHPDMEKIDLGKTAADVLDDDRTEYGAKGLDIDVSADSVYIMGDRDMLSRMITNIADNSLKYKTAERGHLSVEVRRAWENGRSCAVMTFTDDGPGVEESDLTRIFETLYRSDSARKDPGKGSGMGLAIVKKITEQAGGHVSAENVSPHGLRIRISVPEAGQ
ncbi:MAG: ATP-binding protein [Anaerovoracaceae bacterium]